MGVEAAVGEAGLLHDLGHAGAAVAAAPDGAGGGLHDALVGGFLAAGGGSSRGGGSHMMIIIHTWQLERKGYATGRLLCSAMSRK